ncbi:MULTISPECIES: hypothetical protein [unclassified Streptomyces]|uniref:hypothetical protein n=1 Tax=unclassified Streptomyces TaxID=2593676 RepID=UPI00131A8ED9|nr:MULTISPECIES: hypothetical protein [unclassified Streptomyces]
MSRRRTQVGDLLRAARLLGVRDADGVARLAEAMGLPAGAGRAGADAPVGGRAGRRPEAAGGPSTAEDGGRDGERRPVRAPHADAVPRTGRQERPPAPSRRAGPAPLKGAGEAAGTGADATAAGAVRRVELAGSAPEPYPAPPETTGASLLMLRAPLPPPDPTGPDGEPALRDLADPADPAGPEDHPDILDVPWVTAPPRPAPPWDPRSERAVFLAVASTYRGGHTVDHDRLLELVVRSLAGGPLGRPRVPYRQRATTRAGVHLLLDRGESMRPFRDDQAWLAALAARVVPSDRLTVLDFRLRRGASRDGGRTWEPHPVPPHGRPVLLMSDLGRLRPPLPGRNHATPAQWLPYLRRLCRAGTPVVCLTPHPVREYPAAIRQLVTLFTLDRGIPVRAGRSGSRGGRRRSGRGS